MDATQIAERHLIERYLAGQLADPEAEAFEAYIEAHPEVIPDIELVSRMKSGLATLRQRGELKTTVQASRRPWTAMLIAASLAAIAITAVLVLRPWVGGVAPALLATTEELILGRDHQPLPVSAHFSVARTRGSDAPALTPPTGDSTVELSLDLHAAAPGTLHGVEVLRVANGTLEPVGALSDVVSQSDGSLRMYIRGSVLVAGNYLIRVRENGGAPVEFMLRVRQPE